MRRGNINRMIEALISPLIHFTIYLISSFGYFGVFFAMLVESAGIPLPSEIIMPFSGFLVSQGKFDFVLVVVVGALGNLVGSLVAYYIGYILEEAGIRNFIKKWGKWVLVSVDDYDLAEKWFRKYGQTIIFVSRVLPVVRTFISFPAGVARVNLLKFSVLTFLGSLIWSVFLAEVGLKLGENWESVGPWFRKFDIVFAVIFILALAFFFYHKYTKLTKS